MKYNIFKKITFKAVSFFKEINVNWSQLNKLRNLKIISSMYIWIFLVPMAAKAMEMTNDVAKVTVFSYTFDVNLVLPFSWKLFYFSALFFAFATFLYQARCPRFIKEYPTYASFEAEGKPEWHLRPYAEDIGLSYDLFKEELEDAMMEHDNFIPEGKEYIQSVFWNLHFKADKQRIKTLLICVSAYATGFFLIGIVFIQNFKWVLESIFRSM